MIGILPYQVQTYPMFLYGYISEMYKHVVKFIDISTVFDSAKPTESHLVSVTGETKMWT